MNRYLKWMIKILFAVLAFSVVFVFFHVFMVPKFLNESTTIVDGYKELEENSLDIVFLGSSQMFCTVDSAKLTEEYGINASNFGSSSQPITTTAYYLDEALKTQKPKVVMVESTMLFELRDDIKEEALAWNYYPMSPSVKKYQSLLKVTNKDVIKSLKYAYFPILYYHGRWSALTAFDLTYYWDYTYDSRGYVAREDIVPVDMSYYDQDQESYSIPKENVEAVLEIKRICEEKGIKLCFFKSPFSKWTKNMSSVVQDFMKTNDIDFVDLNEYLGEIGIDAETDFSDTHHLNVSGAEKTTDFIGEYLLENHFKNKKKLLSLEN